jgi:hypothetical protein
LGEIGKKDNLWAQKEIVNGIVALLNSKNDEIKSAASISLGGLSLVVLNFYIENT